MKTIITFFCLLIWFMPLSPAWAEPYDAVLGAQLGRECLSEGELDDGALSEISGQGLTVSVREEVTRVGGKIILWDEADCRTTINLSTGYCNYQRNTLSILGR
jgi:hypothetical protein